MTDRPEKKSERFEVRLPYSKKQDFVQACEDQGDTPSSAVRRFIDSYVRRADADTMKMAVRSLPKLAVRRWRQLFAVLIIVCGFMMLAWFAFGFAIASNSKWKAKGLFAEYDKNKNGLIEVGEITENDEHLHRVLNIDGKLGISEAEFFTKGTMHWKFVDPNNQEVLKNDKGLLTHRRITRRTNIIGDDTIKDYKTNYVKFDLTASENIILSVWQRESMADRSERTYYIRSVEWIEGESFPHHVMGSGQGLAYSQTKEE